MSGPEVYGSSYMHMYVSVYPFLPAGILARTLRTIFQILSIL